VADIVLLLNRPDAHGHGESDRPGAADIVAKNRREKDQPQLAPRRTAYLAPPTTQRPDPKAAQKETLVFRTPDLRI
jgi:hypothetical protein